MKIKKIIAGLAAAVMTLTAAYIPESIGGIITEITAEAWIEGVFTDSDGNSFTYQSDDNGMYCAITGYTGPGSEVIIPEMV